MLVIQKRSCSSSFEICERERDRVSVRVCVRERARERDSECVREREREKGGGGERKRDRERECSSFEIYRNASGQVTKMIAEIG
jgi:hypothetical protein